MQINLPSNAEAIVRQKAEAAGFGDDVTAYVAHLISSDEPAMPLNEEALQECEAILARGEADLAAGRTRDLHEAMLDIGRERGFASDE